MKPYIPRGEALTAGPANPKSLWLSVADPQMLLLAMEGNPTYTQPMDARTGGPAGDGEFVYGRDGPLGNQDHPYISGALFVHQQTDAERRSVGDYFVVVAESKRVWEGTATPIPRDLFTGPRDDFWTFDPGTRQYVRLNGPKEA